MSITIQGTFINALPTVEGEGARGHWIRGGFVIEYGEEYPRKVAFSCFGETKVQQANSIPAGQPLQVSFNLESREFNGRYYTELNVTHILLLPAQQPAYYQPPVQQQFQPAQAFQPAPVQQARPAPAPQPAAQYPQPPMPSGLQPQQQAIQMPAGKDDDLPF